MITEHQRQQIKKDYLAGLSIREIENKYGWKHTARYHIRKMGISRSKSEAMRMSIPKRYRDPKLNEQAMSIIEGNLLGDGSVVDNGRGRSAFYGHASRSHAHILWLRILFAGVGLRVSKVYERPPYKAIVAGKVANFRRSYSFQSEAIPALLSLRHRWYRPVKSIPADFCLNRAMLLHWFLGDGSASRTKRGYLDIKLHSQGFQPADNLILIKALGRLGIEAYPVAANGCGVSISIRRTSNKAFFQMIGECPSFVVDDLGYKWPREET